ncbi:hypothetical protein B7494_g7143 [Chlorociboria aeruginascens]|nr:hypothetical protein B7494_g7143 [Chlorociboria aeruginascens]
MMMSGEMRMLSKEPPHQQTNKSFDFEEEKDAFTNNEIDTTLNSNIAATAADIHGVQRTPADEGEVRFKDEHHSSEVEEPKLDKDKGDQKAIRVQTNATGEHYSVASGTQEQTSRGNAEMLQSTEAYRNRAEKMDADHRRILVKVQKRRASRRQSFAEKYGDKIGQKQIKEGEKVAAKDPKKTIVGPDSPSLELVSQSLEMRGSRPKADKAMRQD